MATDFSQDANCQGFWAMLDSGSETDRSTNSNSMAESGGTIPTDADVPAGYSGTSRDFEASETEHLTQAGNLATDISGANQEFSAVGWVKFESVSSTFMNFIIKGSFGSGDVQYSVDYFSTNDLVKFTFENPNNTYNVCEGGSSDWDDGNWHHFAAVYNDTDMRLYKDGLLDSKGADNPLVYSGGILDTSDDFLIGAGKFNGGLGNYFDGLIMEVAIFDRALSAAEVLEIKNDGVTGAFAISDTTVIQSISY